MLNQIDLSRVDLNLLVLFETVMRERHVGRAAARLHVTPSAVSHGLRRLRVLLRDPVFLRNPRGVSPTERATELAPRVAALLENVRSLVGGATPFEPATAQRTFRFGAPDAVDAWLLPRLVATLARDAPGVRVASRQVLPHHALAALDAREIDVVLTDVADLPPRFAHRAVRLDRWVVAVRSGHPFARRPTLDAYCALEHVVVSDAGDLVGFADGLLAKQGRTRRVVLAVPNFLLSLAAIGRTDLAALVPGALLSAYGATFGVRAVAVPFEIPPIDLRLVVPRVALADAGVEWLIGVLARHLDGTPGKTAARLRRQAGDP